MPSKKVQIVKGPSKVKQFRWITKETTRGPVRVQQFVPDRPSCTSSFPTDLPSNNPSPTDLPSDNPSPIRRPSLSANYASQPMDSSEPYLASNDVDFAPVIRSGKSQNDLMRDWLPFRHEYLNIILEREGPTDGRRCSACDSDGSWRCLDCLGGPLFCIRCCRDAHYRQPFHRVEQWAGSYFAPAWLRDVGVNINLGHNGMRCPNVSSANQGPSSQPIYKDVHIDGGSDEGDWEDENDFLTDRHDVHHYGSGGMVIVDRSGIHQLGVCVCECPNAKRLDQQLLDIGIYPASQKRPKTGFTFRVLDDFLIDNRECKVSALSFYSKLRRVTNNAFPHSAPSERPKDRYRELLRVCRQWRDLKHRKWHGFGYDDKNPGSGELALFCPTCPQPNINIPEGWEEDSNQWVYMRSFVMDGNFSAQHMALKKPEDDIPLSDGGAFMVGSTMYKAHLSTAAEDKQRSSCNNHKAVNQVNAVRQNLAATGIGATACARHGCFCPHSVVDFQKGERQMNMDYSFCQAINRTANGIKKVLLMYDIACQYSLHLRDRIRRSPFLQLPESLDIIPSIGVWHVHGHISKCFPRYYPGFIKGSGHVDGEILETLWSQLNLVSGSTRGMSRSHRQEVLDDHMNDSNWKKLVKVVDTLHKKYAKAVSELSIVEDEYKKLISTIPDSLQQWQEDEENAQRNRATDVTAMDIYDVRKEKAPGRADFQLSLAEKETGSGIVRGTVAWLASGLSIEELQSRLQVYVRDLGSRPTRDEQVQLQQRRQRLHSQIDKFLEGVETYLGPMGDVDVSTLNTSVEPQPEQGGSDTEDEANVNHILTSELDGSLQVDSETMVIPLPSSFGVQWCQDSRHQKIVQQEIGLRMGQANDALHQVRIALAQQSFQYRENVRGSRNQHLKTRAWDGVRSTNTMLRRHVKIYSKARHALVQLGADESVLSKYRVLRKADLKVSTAVMDIRLPSRSETTLSWFWNIDVQGDMASDSWIAEFYRVHWLRAKAKLDRAREEAVILRYEMKWTLQYFRKQGQVWAERKTKAEKSGAGSNQLSGQVCYAVRQAVMWKIFEETASSRFSKIIDLDRINN